VKLGFEIVECRPEPYAAGPTLMARIRVTEADGEQIHAIAAKCQIRVEPHRRRYSKAEEEALLDLFGEPRRWGDTLKGFLWTHVSFMVPSFRDHVDVEVPIPCTYDFEVAASKYFTALEEGEIPLIFLFNGTVFSKAAEGSPMGFAVGHVPWDKEAPLRLPVSVWREVMDLHFPGTAWIRLGRESFKALALFKSRHGLPTWEDTVAALLGKAEAEDLVPRNDPADRKVWPKPPPQAAGTNGGSKPNEAAGDRVPVAEAAAPGASEEPDGGGRGTP
jgi:hypothetical protein